MWRRSAPTPPEEMPDVLAECARFLEGQLDEGFGEDRESAPDWVWVSVLAHASEEHLVACAALGSRSKPADRCIWDRTLSFLAGVLLDYSRSRAVPVSVLQHEVVLPIELGLGAHPLAPPTFMRLVLTGLSERFGVAPDQPASATERGSA